MNEASNMVDALLAFRDKAREEYRNPIGTPDNPYVVYVPQWYADRCEAEGTTPQEVYDKTYAESSFRHGRVEIIGDYRE